MKQTYEILIYVIIITSEVLQVIHHQITHSTIEHSVLPTYAVSMTIGRNPYGYYRNINNSNFCESLEKAKQFFKWIYNKDGDIVHPVLNKKARTERFITPLRSSGEQHHPEDQRTPRTLQASALEESEQIDQRSPIPSSDTNSQRSMIRSTFNGVVENTPTNQKNKQGYGTNPNKKIMQSC